MVYIHVCGCMKMCELAKLQNFGEQIEEK